MTKTMEATSAAETDMSDGKTEAIFLDEKTHQQWCSVRTMEGLTQDADVSKFLVHMYLATKERAEGQVVCVFCRSPLNPVCDACKAKRSQCSIPESGSQTSATGRCPPMLTAQAEETPADIHRHVTAFSSPSSPPGAGDTDGDWNQCGVTSVKSASPETSHRAGQCLEPTPVSHSHKAGQLTTESGAAGSACSEAGEAGKRQTRPVKRLGRGRRKSTTSCISDDNRDDISDDDRDDISDDDNRADQTNEPSQWPEAGASKTEHTTATTQSTCIYLGVEDLDTQPPAKDHKHTHGQKRQQRKGLSSGQKEQQQQKISSQQKPHQQQPQHKILAAQQKPLQQNMLSSQQKPQQQQDQQKHEKQQQKQQQKILSTQQKQQQQQDQQKREKQQQKQQQKILSTQQKQQQQQDQQKREKQQQTQQQKILSTQQQQQQQKIRPSPQKQPQVQFCVDIAFICKVCGRSFDKRHRLVSHIRYVHCHWRPFTCDLCPATFQSRSRLQRHVCVTHTNERPYRCEACAASFVDRFALNCHRRTHEVDRKHRYFCELCGKGYHGLNPLKKHLASHSGKRGAPTKTVLCWVCGKAVASSTYLKLHLRKHSPESAITCGLCCKTFTSKQVLDKHLKSRVHRKKLERKNSPLEVCDLDSSIKQSGVTVAGKLWATPSLSAVSWRKECFRNGTFTCEICDKPFSSPKSKKRHERIIHKFDGKEKKIVLYAEDQVDEKHCEISQDGSFDGPGEQNDRADKETLDNKEKTKEDRLLTVPEEHPLSLTDKRPLQPPKKYTCDICHQSFSLRQSVQRHKRNVHMKRRDYGCDLCHKTFTDSYYLKQHKQVYHNPSGEVVRQTVKCDVCDKGFLAKSAMTMHKRTVHYGLQRQSCSKCGKKLRDKFTLERHQKSCRREGALSQAKKGFDDKLDKETDDASSFCLQQTDGQIQPLTALPQVSRNHSFVESASPASAMLTSSETSPMRCIGSTPNRITPTSLFSNSSDNSANSLLLSSGTVRNMTSFISAIAPSATILTSSSLTNSTAKLSDLPCTFADSVQTAFVNSSSAASGSGMSGFTGPWVNTALGFDAQSQGQGEGHGRMGQGQVRMGQGQVRMGQNESYVRMKEGEGMIRGQSEDQARMGEGEGHVRMGQGHVRMGQGHVRMGQGQVRIGQNESYVRMKEGEGMITGQSEDQVRMGEGEGHVSTGQG